MLQSTNVKTIEKVVIRFAGDSGDGMQLAGNIFSNVSAGEGNLISTFPDYPAEIRAPQGSLSGVSGYQVRRWQKRPYSRRQCRRARSDEPRCPEN